MGQVTHVSIRKWHIIPYDRAAAKRLAAREGIPALLAVLLQTRGFSDPKAVGDMLSDGRAFCDPFLLPDMDRAVARVGKALDGFEKIAVYGDYDADGVTATAMVYSYLESCGGNAVYYIPDRRREGYGMNRGAVDALHAQGVTLILTVDTGISALEEIDYAKSLGIDTVVTDHHRPRSELPKAAAVVDAWREGCACPFRDYSGAGVAFKLLSALEGPEAGTDALLDNYADLAAIGTIGDVVPLTGENRLLVKAGLESIARADRPGIRALLEAAGADRRAVTADTVAFAVVPRINATGRMGSSEYAVRLLTTESPEEAGELAAKVSESNGLRRRTEDEVLEQAAAELDRNPALLYDRVIVVAGEGWHDGVIGIVAARITERFGKPCVVLSCAGDEAKGSGRSVEGFSLFDAVSSCGRLLTKYGGHPMAAGMSLPAGNIGALREGLNRYAASLPGPMPAPSLRIDCFLKPEKLSVEIPRSLEALEPFGAGNPRPLFGLAGVTVAEIAPVGGGKHLRLTVRKGGASVTCMKFGTTLDDFSFRPGDTVDLAVALEARPYEGHDTLSVVVRDIRFSGEDEDALIRGRALYEKFRRGEALSPEESAELLPGREDCAAVYRALRGGGGYRGSPESLCCRVSRGGAGLSRLLLILAVFAERGLVRLGRSGGAYTVQLSPAKEKVRLEDSPLLASLRGTAEKAGETNGVA